MNYFTVGFAVHLQLQRTPHGGSAGVSASSPTGRSGYSADPRGHAVPNTVNKTKSRPDHSRQKTEQKDYEATQLYVVVRMSKPYFVVEGGHILKTGLYCLPFTCHTSTSLQSLFFLRNILP